MKAIKGYFSDWSLFEKIWLLSFTAVNIYLYFAFKDTSIGLIASITGMLCVVLTAKGKISNYYPGIINVVFYAYISYGQKYYGEVMLNLMYFLPMQFVGLFLWRRNKSREGYKSEVKIEFMTNRSRFFWSVVSIIATFAYGLVLKKMGGKMPFVDSTSTVLSVIAMILMAARYMEQWILWIIIDVVSIIMWFVVLAEGGNEISIFIMWSAYLVNAVYGLVNWIKIYNSQRREAYEQGRIHRG
jgi:nicotinamide mononucleotide transporter